MYTLAPQYCQYPQQMYDHPAGVHHNEHPGVRATLHPPTPPPRPLVASSSANTNTVDPHMSTLPKSAMKLGETELSTQKKSPLILLEKGTQRPLFEKMWQRSGHVYRCTIYDLFFILGLQSVGDIFFQVGGQ